MNAHAVETAELLYALFVVWFTFSAGRITLMLYRFTTYARTFGRAPQISQDDLVALALAEHRELPAFDVCIPAYREAAVIEGMILRLLAIDYPKSHVRIRIITYADDDQPDPDYSTPQLVDKVISELEGSVREGSIQNIVVPADFDGYFPGQLGSTSPQVCKGRGLNYAIRKLHGEAERLERGYFLSRMYADGSVDMTDRALATIKKGLQEGRPIRPADVDVLLRGHDEQQPCSLVLTRQLRDLIWTINKANEDSGGTGEAYLSTLGYEAAKFHLKLSVNQLGAILLEPDSERVFLRDILDDVEAVGRDTAIAQGRSAEPRIAATRPILFSKIRATQDADALYLLCRQIEPRWVCIYDADAEPPLDSLKYFATRILQDPHVLLFQGPVRPVGNYHFVDSIPKMAGLMLSFWHATLYPRVLHKRAWAHPLAGTNWCSRIDAFDAGKHLANAPGPERYDERRRKLTLHFNPEALTEDLEAGLRMFVEHGVNAEWHPYIEIEQVPENLSALRKQRERWAEGTLDQIYSTASSHRLPLSQRVYYWTFPLSVTLTFITPPVCIVFIAAHAFGAFDVPPIYHTLPLVLAFANLCYVVNFSLVYLDSRRFMLDQLDWPRLLREGARLAAMCREGTCLNPKESKLCAAIAADLSEAQGMGIVPVQPPGHGDRSTEDTRGFQSLMRAFEGLDGPAASARTGTASARGRLRALRRYRGLLRMQLGTPRPRLAALKGALHAALWAFPFLFFQPIPPLTAILRRVRGQRLRHWDKTPRTSR